MKNALHHIHRKDNDAHGTHAWVVLIQRHNVKVRKPFSDGQWGGKRKALAAARAWRDEHMDPLTQYVYEMGRRNFIRRNNRSGIVGVARYERKEQAGKRGSAYWMASWIDENGATRHRKFSVGRWGERGAKQKAIETREREVHRSVVARTAVDG